MEKFKIIDEYDRFYLGISSNGIKETFNKTEYRPNSEGYIIKKQENNNHGNNVSHPPINTPWKGEKLIVR